MARSPARSRRRWAEAVESLRSANALWMDETHYPRRGIGNWIWAAVQPLLAAHFSDPGHPFQRDRGQRFKLIPDTAGACECLA